MIENITGLWEFKKTINFQSNIQSGLLSFETNGQTFNQFHFNKDTLSFNYLFVPLRGNDSTKTIEVYKNGQWIDNKYRCVEITTTNNNNDAINFIKDNANRVKHVKLKDGADVLYPATKASLIQNDGQIKVDQVVTDEVTSGYNLGITSDASMYLASSEAMTLQAPDGIFLGDGTGNISLKDDTVVNGSLLFNHFKNAPILGTDSNGQMQKVNLDSKCLSTLSSGALTLNRGNDSHLEEGIHLIFTENTANPFEIKGTVFPWVWVLILINKTHTEGKLSCQGIGLASGDLITIKAVDSMFNITRGADTAQHYCIAI